jgi:hypothetical protein
MADFPCPSFAGCRPLYRAPWGRNREASAPVDRRKFDIFVEDLSGILS